MPTVSPIVELVSASTVAQDRQLASVSLIHKARHSEPPPIARRDCRSRHFAAHETGGSLASRPETSMCETRAIHLYRSAQEPPPLRSEIQEPFLGSVMFKTMRKRA